MRHTLALSREDLLGRLARVDVEGWNGPAGTALLAYVRANMVDIQVTSTGLAGLARDQATATGWAVAWETLSSPRIRTAAWPWSVVWVAVRRAVRGEWAAGHYLTNARTAWDLLRVSPGGSRPPAPLCWERMVEDGQELTATPSRPRQPVLTVVADLLVGAGWDPELAAQVVLDLAALAQPCDGAATSGWRHVAAEFDLPPWQVRRVAQLLYSVARDSRTGHDADRHPDPGRGDLQGTLIATRVRRPRGTAPTQLAS